MYIKYRKGTWECVIYVSTENTELCSKLSTDASHTCHFQGCFSLNCTVAAISDSTIALYFYKFKLLPQNDALPMDNTLCINSTC